MDDIEPAPDRIVLEPIGTVHGPLETRDAAPRQGAWADVTGRIELEPAYAAGLEGLAAGDRVDVVWYAHRADRSVLTVERDGRRGVFASRSNDRPNPICVTECEVTGVDGATLEMRGIDMLDGTPVLDLKVPMDPSVPGP